METTTQTAIDTILNSDEFIIISRKDNSLTVAYTEKNSFELIAHFLGNEPFIAKAIIELVNDYEVVKDDLKNTDNEAETKTDNP